MQNCVSENNRPRALCGSRSLCISASFKSPLRLKIKKKKNAIEDAVRFPHKPNPIILQRNSDNLPNNYIHNYYALLDVNYSWEIQIVYATIQFIKQVRCLIMTHYLDEKLLYIAVFASLSGNNLRE